MTVRVEVSGKGELAILGQSFNTMVETLYRTQQELLHKENLASVGQLAAGVAHEINNPLGTILLFAEVINKEIAADDQRREDLKMIISETIRCRKIVADLLNFARQQEVLAQECNIHDLLEQVIEGISRKASFQKVTVLRQFSPQLPAIEADQAQLMQVFVNLLDNAADAMPAGGTITISTRLIDNQRFEVKYLIPGAASLKRIWASCLPPFSPPSPWARAPGLACQLCTALSRCTGARSRSAASSATEPPLRSSFR